MCFVTCRYKHILCVCGKQVTELADNSSDSGFGNDTARDHTQRLAQVDETPNKGPSEATEFKERSDATDFKAPSDATNIGPTPDIPNVLET